MTKKTTNMPTLEWRDLAKWVRYHGGVADKRVVREVVRNGGSTVITLCSNTTLSIAEKYVSVKEHRKLCASVHLHGNLIGTLWENGQATFSDAGWPTKTTADRLNGMLLGSGAGVKYNHGKAGQWLTSLGDVASDDMIWMTELTPLDPDVFVSIIEN